MKSNSVLALLGFVASVLAPPALNAADLVWEDNFDGAAGASVDMSSPNGWSGWAGGAKLTGNSSAIFNDGNTAWSQASYPVNILHTYEIAYRFPDYTGDANYLATVTQIDEPWAVEPVDGTNNHAQLRHEIYIGTQNQTHRLYWPVNGESVREAHFNICSYYKDNLASQWQVVQFVIGPTYQAAYVNGELIHFTRSDFSQRTETLNWAPKGSSNARLEVDYVRVYEGDATAWPLPDNLVGYDSFNEFRPQSPSNGFRNNEELWTDENAQKPNGAGQAVLSTGTTTSWRADDANWPFSLTRTFAEESTLEVYVRCPDGLALYEDAYAGIRRSGGNGERAEIYFRGGGLRAFVSDGATESVGTEDLRDYFVGDATTQFQKIDIVVTATSQAFYVNNQLVETLNAAFGPDTIMQPWMKGNGSEPAVRLELDSMALYSGNVVPTPNPVRFEAWSLFE